MVGEKQHFMEDWFLISADCLVGECDSGFCLLKVMYFWQGNNTVITARLDGLENTSACSAVVLEQVEETLFSWALLVAVCLRIHMANDSVPKLLNAQIKEMAKHPMMQDSVQDLFSVLILIYDYTLICLMEESAKY